jgi:ribose transport system permease protein
MVSLNLHPLIVTLGTMSLFRGLANVLPEQKTLPAADKQLPTAFTTEFMRVEMFGQEASQESVLRLMASFSGEEAA